jgi:hypothetical protein
LPAWRIPVSDLANLDSGSQHVSAPVV